VGVTDPAGVNTPELRIGCTLAEIPKKIPSSVCIVARQERLYKILFTPAFNGSMVCCELTQM
jgi:hypothetical protein